MSSALHRLSSPAGLIASKETFDLWQHLGAFSAHETEAALRHLQAWLAAVTRADNINWVGAVRVIQGAGAKADALFGWRLRAWQPFKPDSGSYRKLFPGYYSSDQSAKQAPSHYRRMLDPAQDAHIGLTARASLAGAGSFRVHRLRDGWIDFAAFKHTPHYRLYYRDQGIVDRMIVAFPVAEGAESFLLLDRQGPDRRPFTARDAALAGAAVLGAPELHRRLFLAHGLLVSTKPSSPMERQVLHHLLTGLSEKQIASRTGQKPATLHKYVTALYARYRVRSRAALMALWLNPTG
jgi:DNA-binding CsgD family transcriptional regulator